MNLPIEFVDQTKAILCHEYANFEKALESEIPISIRLNKEKTKTVSSKLASPVSWCHSGYYLERRPQFTFDPLFHAGSYYVQEASSMFIEQALKQYADDNITILDLCAAPGGKSTLIANHIGQNGLLVSNEVIRSRANILAENVTKWGNPNVIVTNNDPDEIGKLKNYFDLILVDAPCSGEGMFRKDEGAISEWSLSNVQLCKERQQRIVADIWDALKPNGLLLYSTCTYNIEENEKNVLWIKEELGAEILPLEIDPKWGISSSVIDEVVAYRFFPHKTKGEGFFFALLRKNEDVENNLRPKNKKRDKASKIKEVLSAEYKNYIKNSDKYTFFNKNQNWHVIHSSLYEDYMYINSSLNVLSAGICLGGMKGKSFIPNQSLAMSTELNEKAFVSYEIDWKMAIAYLRKEAIDLSDQPLGYILLLYKNTPLGFVKNIGNRANNLYPQEWRIRSSNIPLEEVSIL